MDLEMGDDYNRPTYESETETAKRMLDAYAEIQAKLTKSEDIRFEQGNSIMTLELELDQAKTGLDIMQKLIDGLVDDLKTLVNERNEARQLARKYFRRAMIAENNAEGAAEWAQDAQVTIMLLERELADSVSALGAEE